MAADEALDDASYQRLPPSQPQPSSMFLALSRPPTQSSTQARTTPNPSPGPGAYSYGSTLKAAAKGSWPAQRQHFGSTSQRGAGQFELGRLLAAPPPGPGAYSPNTSAFPKPGSAAAAAAYGASQSRRLTDEAVRDQNHYKRARRQKL
jgi:hypothetical protein